MNLRFKAIVLLSFFSLVLCISLQAAEVPVTHNDAEETRNDGIQVLANEGYTSELLLPRLSFYLGLLCNRNNKAGRVIAMNASREAIALSHDGNYCAFALKNDRFARKIDPLIQVYDTRTGTLVHSLSGHTEDVTCLAFSPNQQLLFLGAEDGTICVWNFITGKLVRKHIFPGFFGPLYLYKFSTDCRAVLLRPGGGVAAAPGAAYWNFDSGNLIRHRDLDLRYLGCPMDFASTDQIVFIDNNEIFFWDIVNKCKISSYPIPSGYSQYECAYCNNLVALRNADSNFGCVAIWDATTNNFLKSICLERGKLPMRLLFSADGNFLAIAYHGVLRKFIGVDIYDVRTRSLIQEFPWRPDECECLFPIAFDQYGQLATIGSDGKVRLFNAIPQNVRQALHALSLNQLIVLMKIIPPLVRGHVIHLTPNSQAWNLVNQLPTEIRSLVEPCIRLTWTEYLGSFLPARR